MAEGLLDLSWPPQRLLGENRNALRQLQHHKCHRLCYFVAVHRHLVIQVCTFRARFGGEGVVLGAVGIQLWVALVQGWCNVGMFESFLT